ncbi:hypothetical protein [Streptomyces sp. CL12-4]|uniref:hypothetical protein n=1 Tax=Streptomyces sp. CL12-4 TaxID=2810306 RepID=UPI001EFBE143|nr:hypothetical protein [Streptomyces sp. CL12-4]MCG8971864.1 hypothetical protein [Streptomyces sp. CL12-4]
MSSPHTEKLEVVVGDFPTQAALINYNGVRTLCMGRGQTFSRAVDNVLNVLPGITREAAETLIREQCPEFQDFDTLFGLTEPAPPSVERPPAEPEDDVVKEAAPRNRRRTAVLVAALLPALVASWALGRYTNTADTSPAVPQASAPDATPDPTDTAAPAAPFTDAKFEFFTGSSQIDCDPVSTLEAECTDSDGMVMFTKAATGPDSTIFTFSYGSERLGLRVFYDAEYAQTWARQDGTQELYPNLRVHGRYILWGTDPGRISEYVELLEDADRSTPKVAQMGGATPLPPRLAALTLGTLGLDQREMHQLMAKTPTPLQADTPAIVAARMILGLDKPPASRPAPGDEDIVAIAAGIEPTPATSNEPVDKPTTKPISTDDTPPAGETGSGGTETTPPAPPTTTKPPTGTPSSETPAPSETTPPAGDTKPPTETTKPPTTTSPTGTPPPQPTTPPAEPAPPADPAPENPAPGDTAAPPAEGDQTAPPVEEPPAEESPGEEPQAEDPAEPADEPTVPPAEEPAVPVEDLPTTETPPPDQPTDESDDDLLVLDSAWTVAAA